MKRNFIIAAVIAGAGFALLTNQNFKSKILPSGLLSQEKPLDSSNLDVTPEPIADRPRVEITTSKGKITLELRPDLAPKSVANFLAKWNNGSCVGTKFHRVEDWVVQGCDPLGDGTGGNTNLQTETSSEPFVAGSVGVARKNTPKELSNDSQFFILKKDAASLNGEYTYLGKVVSGLDVVNQIAVGDTFVTTDLLTK